MIINTFLVLNGVFDLFNLYTVIIPLLFATFGQALIWSNSIAGALKDFSKNQGTAAAVFSCLQMLLSALVSAWVALPHEHNAIPIACVLISLAVIAWVAFYKKVLAKPGGCLHFIFGCKLH